MPTSTASAELEYDDADGDGEDHHRRRQPPSAAPKGEAVRSTARRRLPELDRHIAQTQALRRADSGPAASSCGLSGMRLHGIRSVRAARHHGRGALSTNTLRHAAAWSSLRSGNPHPCSDSPWPGPAFPCGAFDTQPEAHPQTAARPWRAARHGRIPLCGIRDTMGSPNAGSSLSAVPGRHPTGELSGPRRRRRGMGGTQLISAVRRRDRSRVRPCRWRP